MILTKILIFIACCCILHDSSEAVVVECEYEKFVRFGSAYGCVVKNNLNINSRDTAVIDKATGTHLNGNTENDVAVFVAENKSIEFMPRGLEKVFENLEIILIGKNRIKEVHQEDLVNYVKLEILDLSENEIEILEEGLFEYNPQLNWINLWKNKIFHVDEHVFDKLHNLKWLYLDDNECIQKNSYSDTELKELISETKVKCRSNEFSTINKNLNELERDIYFETIRTCQEFGVKLQKIENQFQQSNISSSIAMQKKIMKVSNEGVFGQFCEVKDKLAELEESFKNIKNETIQSAESFKDETKKMIERLTASINEETRKILGQIDNARKVDEEIFASPDAINIKVVISRPNKAQESQVTCF